MTPRKCSLCAREGHNMTTCQQLPFRQRLAHRLYVHKCQKWLETYERARTVLDNPSDDPRVININIENRCWLRNPLHFRLLKSYLYLNGQGTDAVIRDYIFYVYRYLVLKKNRLLPYSITNPILNTPPLISYVHYDYLLDTIPVINTTPRQYDIIPVINTTPRQYGINVKQSTNLDITQESLETCAICYDDYTPVNFVKTNCGHSFCVTCVINTIQILPTHKKLSCAMCRSNITYLSCYNNLTNTILQNTLHI